MRLGRTSIRCSCCWRHCGSSGPRRWGSFAQIAVVALGAVPVFWLGRRHSGPNAWPVFSRSRISRTMGRDERRRCDSSGDVRDHVPALRGLVPRLRPARPVRDLRGPRDVDGRADGAADPRPRALVRLRAGEASRRLRHRARRSRLVVRRRLAGRRALPEWRKPVLRFLRRDRRLAAGRRPDARHRSRSRVRRAGRDPRHRLRDPARDPAPLSLPALAGARGGCAPAVIRQYTSDFRSMTDPRYHSVAVISRSSSQPRSWGSRGCRRRGGRSLPEECSRAASR